MNTKFIFNNKTKLLIRDILKDYNPTKLDQKKINEIKNKFKEKLYGYEYISNHNNIKLGDVIRYVKYDINFISGGPVVKIVNDIDGSISHFELKMENNFNRKIRPNRYIIFKKINNSTMNILSAMYPNLVIRSRKIIDTSSDSYSSSNNEDKLNEESHSSYKIGELLNDKICLYDQSSIQSSDLSDN